MGTATHYHLTPADVADLRASVRWRLHDHLEPGIALAWINYAPADDMFILHAYGHTQALSVRLEVLAACLRCERAEPGFIERILNPAEDVRMASLTPDLARAERMRQYEERQRQQAHTDAQTARTVRRNSILPPTDVSGFELDDLL